MENTDEEWMKVGRGRGCGGGGKGPNEREGEERGVEEGEEGGG